MNKKIIKLSTVLFKSLFIIGTPILLIVALIIPILLPISAIISIPFISLPIILFGLWSLRVVFKEKKDFFKLLLRTKTNLISFSILSALYIGLLLKGMLVLTSKETRISANIHEMAITANALNGSFLKSTEEDTTGSLMQLVSEEIKFFLKKLFSEKHLAQHFTEKILDFNVKFTSYTELKLLYEEVFVHRTYFFKSPIKNPFIIDCGSNIGMTVLYFKKLYPNAKIAGFEPEKTSFEILQSNVENNKLSNVEIYHKALHKNEGTITVNFSPGATSNSIFSQTASKDNIQNIDCVKLSRYINEPVHFLKMDTEGAEHFILEDLDETNKLKMVEQMIIEYHPIKTKGYTLAKVLGILDRNGFEYTLSTNIRPPFKQEEATLLIYAYNKTNSSDLKQLLRAQQEA